MKEYLPEKYISKLIYAYDTHGSHKKKDNDYQKQL